MCSGQMIAADFGEVRLECIRPDVNYLEDIGGLLHGRLVGWVVVLHRRSKHLRSEGIKFRKGMSMEMLSTNR